MKAINDLCQRGLDKFYANDGWKGIYDAAPEGAKESLEVMFQNSLCEEEGTPLSAEELLKIARNRTKPLRKKDYEYLLTFAKDPRQAAFYKRCVAEATD